jgi:hypothetical protein
MNNFDSEFNEFAELGGVHSGVNNLNNVQNMFKTIGSNMPLPGFASQDLNNNLFMNMGNIGNIGNNSNLNGKFKCFNIFTLKKILNYYVIFIYNIKF